MMLHLLMLAAGLFFVIKGGDLFVDSSVAIARRFHIPRVIIGGTLVSVATTLPELVVSVTASMLHDSGIALGNAVGSAIANIGLIVGLTVFLSASVQMPKAEFRDRFYWMSLAACLVIFLSWNQTVGMLEGIFLFAFGIAYLIYNVWHISRAGGAAEKQQVFEEPGSAVQKSWLRFFLGAVLVVAGSRLLVYSGIKIATALGIPSVIIGLTIIAVGTSLPELVTAVTSALKGVPDLSVGNIVGANVLNLTVITGLSAWVYPLSLDDFMRFYSFPFLALFIVILGLLFLRSRMIFRGYGLVMILIYAGYVLGMVLKVSVR